MLPDDRAATSERHWSVRLPWKKALELQLQDVAVADAAAGAPRVDRLCCRALPLADAAVAVAIAAGRRGEDAPAGAMAGTRIASISANSSLTKRGI